MTAEHVNQSTSDSYRSYLSAGTHALTIAAGLSVIISFALLGTGCATLDSSSHACSLQAPAESLNVETSVVAHATSTASPAGSQFIDEASAQMLRDTWGIEVSSLRLSAGGNMIDFRYKVDDPALAGILADPAIKPYLIDQASGYTFLIPNTPKLGPLRQSADQLTPGRIYFMLFSNPGCFIKSGNKVTIAIGDFRAENLTVR